MDYRINASLGTPPFLLVYFYQPLFFGGGVGLGEGGWGGGFIHLTQASTHMVKMGGQATAVMTNRLKLLRTHINEV